MSSVPSVIDCPLCLKNNLLQGGLIVELTSNWYVYLFQKPDGSFERAMINPVGHYRAVAEMPPGAGDEYFRLYDKICRLLLPGVPHNLYSNNGWAAGERVPIHFHSHVVLAPRDGAPSQGMGLGLLRQAFDTLASEVLGVADDCGDNTVADKLRTAVQRHRCQSPFALRFKGHHG